MYEELIKQLKDYSTSRKGEIAELTEAAADAIEQLSNAGSAYGRGWTLGYDAGREKSKPRWITVRERLPEKAGAYLVCETWDNGHGVMYNVRVVSYSLNLNNVDEYAFHGKKNKRPGWFDCDSEYGHYETGKDITHWMPLPEFPEEDEG